MEYSVVVTLVVMMTLLVYTAFGERISSMMDEALRPDEQSQARASISAVTYGDDAPPSGPGPDPDSTDPDDADDGDHDRGHGNDDDFLDEDNPSDRRPRGNRQSS